MAPAENGIGAAEKQEALERVLAGHTLGRSEQLRRLLKYLADAHAAGRESQIGEYDIAIEVLGRPKDFDAAADSTVRNRLFALRRKLDEYYAAEDPQAPVRIQLPKGTYGLQFTRVRPEPAPVRRVRAAWWAAGGFIAGVAVAAALFALWPARDGSPPSAAPVLAAAWAPLLSPDADVILSVATPAHLIVRQTVPEPAANLYDAPKQLDGWYRQFGPVPQTGPLRLVPTRNTAQWGDVAAMCAVMKLLAAARTHFTPMPERLLGSASLKQRNAVLIGTPEYSSIIGQLLDRTPLTIGFSDAERVRAVVDRKTGAPVYLRTLVVSGIATFDYGLVTVLHSEGAAPGAQKTVIISGLSSASAAGAAEYFCSAQRLEELRKRFGREGLPGFPSSFQVVVRCNADTLTTYSRYETHRVIAR